jgi:DNA-binding LacI/PurR family transcriptional regulator
MMALCFVRNPLHNWLFSGNSSSTWCFTGCRNRPEQAHQVMGDVPVIYADRFPHANDRSIGCVGVDNVLSAMDATQYVLSLRHRRIAIITGPQQSKNSADRLEGYRRAMRAARVPVGRNLVRFGDNDIASGHRAAIELLVSARRPTAAVTTFYFDERFASGALHITVGFIQPHLMPGSSAG